MDPNAAAARAGDDDDEQARAQPPPRPNRRIVTIQRLSPPDEFRGDHKLEPYLDPLTGKVLRPVAGDAVAFACSVTAAPSGSAASAPAGATEAAAAAEVAHRFEAPLEAPRVVVLGDPQVPTALATALRDLALGERARVRLRPASLALGVADDAGRRRMVAGGFDGGGGLGGGGAAAAAAAGDSDRSSSSSTGSDSDHGSDNDDDGGGGIIECDIEVAAVIPGHGRLSGRAILSRRAAELGSVDLGGLASTRRALRPRRAERGLWAAVKRRASVNVAAPFRCFKGMLRAVGLRR